MSSGIEDIIVLVTMGILGLLAIANLVFFILVVVQMFKHEQSGLGIACILLALCTGLGQPLAFIMGWVKAGEWNIKRMMFAWTGVLVFSLMMVCVVGVATSLLGQKASATFTSVGMTIGGGGPVMPPPGPMKK
jgi:hypothetical protein